MIEHHRTCVNFKTFSKQLFPKHMQKGASVIYSRKENESLFRSSRREVFRKESCLEKFRKSYRKTLAPESLF